MPPRSRWRALAVAGWRWGKQLLGRQWARGSYRGAVFVALTCSPHPIPPRPCRPWLGSFGSMGEMGGLLDQDPPSPTLFATSQGRVFADLSGAPVASSDLLLSTPEVVAAPAAEHPEDSRGGRQAMAQEVSVLRRKAEEGRQRGPENRGPRANVARRRYRMIGQARRMN